VYVDLRTGYDCVMKTRTLYPRLIGDPVWRDSEHICALADDDRHLGHVINNMDGWHACDGTKLDSNGTGFKYLGRFDRAVEAKHAVDLSVSRSGHLTRAAGSCA
jgi:hypothetical protein